MTPDSTGRSLDGSSNGNGGALAPDSAAWSKRCARDAASARAMGTGAAATSGRGVRLSLVSGMWLFGLQNRCIVQNYSRTRAPCISQVDPGTLLNPTSTESSE